MLRRLPKTTPIAALLCWAWMGAQARADFGGPVNPGAYELFDIAGLPVTNTMVTSWVFVAMFVILFRLLAGKPQLIPSRGQAVIEGMVESIHKTIEPIVGARMVKPTFPLLVCLFLYILFMNWSALLPGAGTFGLMHEATITAVEVPAFEAAHYHVTPLADGQFRAHHFDYFFRPTNADLNTTLALAAISWFAWLYFVLRYAGLKALAFDLFGNKADKREIPLALYLLLTLIFLGVGIIELVSIAFRLVSLSFRLYGNVFGGENLLSRIHGLISYVLPVPFYFLEVLIGLIQAFVFTLLVAVYIGLICNHEGGEHAHDEEHGDAHPEASPAPAAH